MRIRYFSLLLFAIATACAHSASSVSVSESTESLIQLETRAPSPPPVTRFASLAAEAPTVGVMVMAHGGGPEWNASVEAAVRPIADRLPTAIAYGMGNPMTLEAGLEELSAQGVEKVAVVRLFISGDSFRDQTEYFLGIRKDRPDDIFLMGGDPTGVGPIDHELSVITHPDGLMLSPQAIDIAVDRARAASVDAEGESVLIIAHGMGDPAENDRVLAALDPIAKQLEADGFVKARAATLREDWADARAVAEEEIRDFVESETAAGRRVIVVPMRLSGFGPYADVLEGLDYVPTPGLLPHDEIASWVGIRAGELICGAGWSTECAATHDR